MALPEPRTPFRIPTTVRMPDPIKAAIAALGTAFAAGAAWMTLKHRVDRVHGDLNRMGRERVKKVEDGLTALGGRMDEHREHVDARHEALLEREALLRERVARLESTVDLLRAELARVT